MRPRRDICPGGPAVPLLPGTQKAYRAQLLAYRSLKGEAGLADRTAYSIHILGHRVICTFFEGFRVTDYQTNDSNCVLRSRGSFVQGDQRPLRKPRGAGLTWTVKRGPDDLDQSMTSPLNKECYNSAKVQSTIVE